VCGFGFGGEEYEGPCDCASGVYRVSTGSIPTHESISRVLQVMGSMPRHRRDSPLMVAGQFAGLVMQLLLERKKEKKRRGR